MKKSDKVINPVFMGFLCDKAGPEWKYYDDGVSYIPELEESSIYAIYTDCSGKITGGYAHYELLLQCAIEGINREDTYDIQQNRSNVSITDLYTGITGGWELVPNEEIATKEAALRWIMDEGNRR